MNIHSQQSGFTLIEMLVSLALFTIVATIATGTLLSLIGNNGRLVNEQVVMSSLSFALDSMTREIRTGSEYVCDEATTIDGATYDETAVQDCDTSGESGLSFREGGESITNGLDDKRIAYYVENGVIMRRVGDSSNAAQPLTSAEVNVTELQFFVEGTDPLTGGGEDTIQPTVTILVTATDVGDNLGRSFTLQSTVTQRALDI